MVALDAKAGRVFWVYQHNVPTDLKLCCGSVNRGLGILGDVLFMGTLDAQLVALDARTGRPIWKTVVADYRAGYSLTLAPLIIKDEVLIGTAGGEYGIRGFVAAYDTDSGILTTASDVLFSGGVKATSTHWTPAPARCCGRRRSAARLGLRRFRIRWRGSST